MDNSIVGQRITGPEFVCYPPEFSNCSYTKVAAATAFEDRAQPSLLSGGNRHSSSFANFLSYPLENHPAQIDARQAFFAHQNPLYLAMAESYRDVPARTN
jgi:hypothetical protein